jgi:glycosyltransferase involved in cell wall biosynthesis
MPQRGMLKELIKIRSSDTFIFAVRKGSLKNSILKDFFSTIKQNTNIQIIEDKKSDRYINLLTLLHLQQFCSMPIKADLYINLDLTYLGAKNTTIINLIADLSSIKKGAISTLNLLGKMIRRSSYKAMVKNARHIVAISYYTLDQMHAHSPETRIKSSCIYNGIDNEWFGTPLNKDIPKENYFLWWGFVSKRKNLEGLLQAYKIELSDQNLKLIPDIHILGRNFISIQKIVKNDSMLRDKVKFFDNLNNQELIKKVDGCQGVLFPSFYEGFGLPVIESFARGKQVLTSDITALKEVTQGKAIYCDPFDINSIAKGIKSLILLKKDNISEIMERKVIAQAFTYKNSAIAFDKLISKIANEDF